MQQAAPGWNIAQQDGMNTAGENKGVEGRGGCNKTLFNTRMLRINAFIPSSVSVCMLLQDSQTYWEAKVDARGAVERPKLLAKL